MGNVLVDTAIQGLRLAGLPVPPVSFIEMLINEGEDVLSAIPRLVTTIEAMGGAWSILEEVAYGMEQYSPIGYVQRLVDQHFAPAIQVVEDIHRSKITLIETHRTLLTHATNQLSTLAPANASRIGQTMVFTGAAANTMNVRFAEVSVQMNRLLDVMDQSRQIDQDLLTQLQFVMKVGMGMVVLDLALLAIGLVLAPETVGGSLAIAGIVDAGLLGAEASILLGAVIACFLVWGLRHALLAISNSLSHSQTTPVQGTHSAYTYQPNPKHGPTKKGNISAEPTNGQKSLDNSVPIKPTSTRRVGVDPDTGEIVVFDETHPGKEIFHGHVRSWDELTAEMKKALIDAGLVDKRGRPIKKK